MILARCDINTCKKEMPTTSVRKANLLDKTYDLCEDCFRSLSSFIEIRLTGGEAFQKQIPFTITPNVQPGAWPSINIPSQWIPTPAIPYFTPIPGQTTYPIITGGTLTATPPPDTEIISITNTGAVDKDFLLSTAIGSLTPQDIKDTFTPDPSFESLLTEMGSILKSPVPSTGYMPTKTEITYK